MLSIQTAIAFFGVSCLLGITPGPDNIFVMVQSATYGKRAGMLVVLGLCTGLIGHTTAVALGLAAVFAASETAFLVLKMLGAAYLAYLAWGAFRAPVSDGGADAAPSLPPRQLYARGVVMNLTNPKVVFSFWRSCRSLWTHRAALSRCNSPNSAAFLCCLPWLPSAR